MRRHRDDGAWGGRQGSRRFTDSREGSRDAYMSHSDARGVEGALPPCDTINPENHDVVSCVPDKQTQTERL